MVRTLLARIMLCVAVLAFVSVTALAATKDGVITINGGKQTVMMNGQHNFHPAAQRPARLKTIYSNLGSSSTDVYYPDEGWTVSGSSSTVDAEYWIAMPFTPTTNAKVQQIDVAVGYLGGTNQTFTITLANDRRGLPGKAIQSWFYHKGMFDFGDCCALETVKEPKGLAVKAHKKYWIEVTTNSKDADLWGAWLFTYNYAEGTFAYNLNDGGWETEDSYLTAFDVLGN